MRSSPFLEKVRNDIRLRGYSIRTEKTYLFWIKQFILFNNKRHPTDMGVEEIKAFLTWLAVTRHVAVNTQKVALNAVVPALREAIRAALGVQATDNQSGVGPSLPGVLSKKYPSTYRTPRWMFVLATTPSTTLLCQLWYYRGFILVHD